MNPSRLYRYFFDGKKCDSKNNYDNNNNNDADNDNDNKNNNNYSYHYMAGSARGQDEANPVF